MTATTEHDDNDPLTLTEAIIETRAAILARTSPHERPPPEDLRYLVVCIRADGTAVSMTIATPQLAREWFDATRPPVIKLFHGEHEDMETIAREFCPDENVPLRVEPPTVFH